MTPDNSTFSLRTTQNKDEPTLQAAKWLQIQMLIDAEELGNLFAAMGDFYIFRVGALTRPSEGQVAPSDFIDCYKEYIACLKEGKIPELSRFRRFFSVVITQSLEAVYAFRPTPEEQIIRAAKPIIQTQMHSMHFSPIDKKFRPMVFGSDSITWGLQFSFPQIYQDEESMAIKKVSDSGECLNIALFKQLQQWQRSETIPTPFMVGGEKINVPMRIGKKCLSWVNGHPQLIEKGINVVLK